MSKIESSAGKALYEQQETKLSQQSAAFIELLTKRGILGDSSIDDDRVRQAKKEKKKSMYHNTLLLLQHYRTILWTLECFPSSVAEELDRPLKDLDTLLDRIDLELGMNNRKLEGRMESVRRSRLLVDRLNDAVSILKSKPVKGTQISGGHISTTATGTDGKVSSVEMFNTAQFEKPAAPHSVVTATDGSTWYQMASGEGRNAFYDAPGFTGSPAESEQVAAAFPGAAEGTVLRNTGDGIMEAGSESGNSLWYNSAYYNEPEAPHTVMQAANGVDWYAMQQHAEAPAFEQGEAADTYNQAAFRNFMPGFEQQVAHVDGTHREDGHFEVRHADGSGTAFYDTARFAAPRGDYQVYEDVRGQQWIAIHGDPAVERKPVFEDGKPVYDGENVRTVSVESVRYKNMPSRFKEPEKRPDSGIKAPKRRK